jgi:PhzF family phenazine biosynthesis protein
MGSTCVNWVPLYHVDAFARKPFAGNPAAVCLLDRPCEDGVLQSIAEEMNLSETAFLLKRGQKPIQEEWEFSLRWFTPKTEVNLCGHATLATAAVLFYDVGISAEKLSFETRSGRLTATREDDGIFLDFPSYMTTHVEPNRELLEAAGIDDFVSTHFSRESLDLLVVLRDEEAVRSLKPNFDRLRSMKSEKLQGIIVTSRGHGLHDFVSRYFAPWVGIDEDPVTGAAHVVLGPFWSDKLRKKEMRAFQASARGGELAVRILAPGRVGLLGNAVIVSKGELRLQ